MKFTQVIVIGLFLSISSTSAFAGPEAAPLGQIQIESPGQMTDLFLRAHPNSISKDAVEHAFAFYFKHRQEFVKKNIITIVDYTQDAEEKRMHVIQLKRSFPMQSFLAAHGQGYSNRFPTTVHTVPGGYRTGKVSYWSEGKKRFRMDIDFFKDGEFHPSGLEVHPIKYGPDQPTHGCVGLQPADYKVAAPLIVGESCLYIFQKGYL